MHGLRRGVESYVHSFRCQNLEKEKLSFFFNLRTERYAHTFRPQDDALSHACAYLAVTRHWGGSGLTAQVSTDVSQYTAHSGSQLSLQGTFRLPEIRVLCSMGDYWPSRFLA